MFNNTDHKLKAIAQHYSMGSNAQLSCLHTVNVQSMYSISNIKASYGNIEDYDIITCHQYYVHLYAVITCMASMNVTTLVMIM